ncbi:MAG: bacteriohopanetetrol glucosamine biosynthesis glycosyltransferase HpnI [Commensalibacter sp.]
MPLFKLKPSFLINSCRVFAIIGCIQAIFGAFLIKQFNKKQKNPVCDLKDYAGVTILKPLYGHEPLLEEALSSFCDQDYPKIQIIFGVQNANDPAIKVVQELQKRYPTKDIDLIIDPTIHGTNLKVSNLINMAERAKHEILIISDSDVHAPNRNFIQNMIACFSDKKVGLVTSLYAGLPASMRIIQRLAAAHINYIFLPGVLIARHLGRQDCLGASSAIKREVLQQIGGLESLLNHVADDAILGQLVRKQGLHITLAPNIVKTTVYDSDMKFLYQHELRWNRTIKNLEPLGFTFSFLQLPLFWASLSLLFNPFRYFSWVFFGLCWGIKGISCRIINRKLHLEHCSIFSLLPFRDWLSAIIMMNSFRGKHVNWRGKIMKIRNDLR